MRTTADRPGRPHGREAARQPAITSASR
jgi:hypothetical protein